MLAHGAVHGAFAGYTGITVGLVNTHVSLDVPLYCSTVLYCYTAKLLASQMPGLVLLASSLPACLLGPCSAGHRPDKTTAPPTNLLPPCTAPCTAVLLFSHPTHHPGPPQGGSTGGAVEQAALLHRPAQL